MHSSLPYWTALATCGETGLCNPTWDEAYRSVLKTDLKLEI